MELIQEKSILVVEDDKIILDYMSKILGLYLKNVYCFENAESAFSFIQENEKPHIVITDIELPGINGLEFAKKVKAFDTSIEIIVLTSYATVEYLKEAVTIGLLDYLEKPISLDSLKTILGKYCSKLRDSEELIDLANGISFSRKNRELFTKEKTYKLTKRESMLLEVLIKNRGQVVPKDIIIDKLWEENTGSEAAFKNLLLRLRKKLENRALIVNHLNFGYTIQ